MIVDKNKVIKNSLGVKSEASFAITLDSEEKIPAVVEFAKNRGVDFVPLGMGTNTLPHRYIDAVILYLENKGIKKVGNDLKIKAGETWDDVVKFAILNNLQGIETLSWIPGKAGSAPIQNIGAYGTEIGDIIKSVYVFNRANNSFEIISKKGCDFSYRNSIFKKNPNKYIVAEVVISLNRSEPQIPQYKDVQMYFENKKTKKPSLLEIRDTIIKIRKSKLPDYNKIPNAGSYFTNPIVEKNLFKKLLSKYKDMPYFKIEGKVKIPAGFLIEKSGLKGKWVGNLKTHNRNALVLTNPRRADIYEVLNSENLIRQKVFENFGINLEREVVLLK